MQGPQKKLHSFLETSRTQKTWDFSTPLGFLSLVFASKHLPVQHHIISTHIPSFWTPISLFRSQQASQLTEGLKITPATRLGVWRRVYCRNHIHLFWTKMVFFWLKTDFFCRFSLDFGQNERFCIFHLGRPTRLNNGLLDLLFEKVILLCLKKYGSSINIINSKVWCSAKSVLYRV